VSALYQAGFPFNRKGTPPKGLIDLAGAAVGSEDGISYNDLYRVLQERVKKQEKLKIPIATE